MKEFFSKYTKDFFIKSLACSVAVCVFIVALFFIVKIGSELKSYRYIGQSGAAANVITVSGEGEVFAVPDIANITFTVREEAKTVKEAQNAVQAKIGPSLDLLRLAGIADKDIKTANYNSYPKYEYSDGVVCLSYPCPPRPQNQVQTGFEVSQTVAVKVRDADNAGTIIEGLGQIGVTDLSGPSFSIDDEDELQAEARKNAIKDARTKAKRLARDLHVRLGGIVNFSESGNYPIYFAKGAAVMSADSQAEAAPELPKGENKITSNVSITYEIR